MAVHVEHYGAREPTRQERVRQWLESVRLLNLQINSKLEQIECLRAMQDRCTQIVSVPTAGGAKHDWTDTSARLIELEDSINTDIDRLILRREEITAAISQLPEAQKTLLELRYLEGLSWRAIARKMEIDRTTCWRWHADVLEILQIPENCNGVQHRDVL